MPDTKRKSKPSRRKPGRSAQSSQTSRIDESKSRAKLVPIQERESLSSAADKMVRFSEHFAISEAKIEGDSITDVPVLRSVSKNRRNYSKVLKRAVEVFEGATVYVGHKDQGDRVEDICGKIEGLYLDGDCVKAKRLTPIGVKANVLAETIRSAPDRAGLSIEGFGKGTTDQEGICYIETLVPGDGVALTHRPGAVKSLLESHLTEGVLADKIKADDLAERARKLQSAAFDQIWSAMYSADQDTKSSLGRVKEIINDWASELDKLTGVRESRTAASPTGLQTLHEELNMNVTEIKSLDELRTLRPELFESEDTGGSEGGGDEQGGAGEGDNGSKRKLREAQARAEKAEAALKAFQESAKREKELGATASKVMDDFKVPAAKRTPVLVREMVKAGSEDAMKELMEHYRALGLFNAPASPYTPRESGGGVARTVAPIHETAATDDDKPLFESITKDTIRKMALK